LHVASDPAHKGFWATAEFRPSGRVTPRAAIDFQDGGNIGIFRSGNDISWHMSGVGGEPFPCPARVPPGILAAWGLAPSPLCVNHARHHRASRPPRRLAVPNAGARTIAQVAESQVGVGDTPVSRSFSGPDCDSYTALVGQRPGSAGCGVNTRFRVRDQNEFWCADFAKWVWRQAGVRSGLGTLNPAAASFYTWARQHGQRPRFGSDAPAVGDAVVFYPPWAHTPTGAWADHVGIVVAVHSSGTVDLVNGDFGGGGVPITVEQNNDISLASWASQVWNRGEKWIFVSPGRVRAPRPHRPAPARPRLPVISSLTASPSFLPGAGGDVTLAVSASHATSYSFTSSPSGPTGLTSAHGDSGQASDTVTVPLNATGRPASYTFTVTTAGPAGSTSSAVSVTTSSLVSGGYATPRYGMPGQTDIFGVTAAGAVTVTWTSGRGRWSTAPLTPAGFARRGRRSPPPPGTARPARPTRSSPAPTAR
jgi:CHAP domain